MLHRTRSAETASKRLNHQNLTTSQEQGQLDWADSADASGGGEGGMLQLLDVNNQFFVVTLGSFLTCIKGAKAGGGGVTSRGVVIREYTVTATGVSLNI